jgi:cytochrome c-type biogenesis protein CcmH/NrfF
MKLEIDAVTLWLIPAGIALWFMIWVLWHWRREERRRDHRPHQSFGASGSPHRNWG